MSVSNGRQWIETFKSINEFYLNVGRMLMSADEILERYSIYLYDDWNEIFPSNKSPKVAAALSNRETLIYEETSFIPAWLIRQYYPSGLINKEVITIGAVLWFRYNSQFKEPLCIASRISCKNEAIPDDIYWIAVAQAFAENPEANGKIKAIDKKYIENLPINEVTKQTFSAVVKDDKFLSIAIPLLEITTPNDLKNRLLEPLLEYKMS